MNRKQPKSVESDYVNSQRKIRLLVAIKTVNFEQDKKDRDT